GSIPVQPLADFLAGLELGDVFLAHVDLFAGAWIAAHARRAVLDRKGPETAQFHPSATGQGIADLVENGVDDIFDISMEKVRVFRCELFDEFGFDHSRRTPPGAIRLNGFWP